MIIDNPQAMREIIEDYDPYFTHPGAEEIYTDLSEELDAYATCYGCMAERIWNEEYLGRSGAVGSQHEVIGEAVTLG